MIAEDRPARVGIVGCGDVTNLYLPGTAPFRSIELVACSDLDADRAAALSARGGFPAVSLEELRADPTIEIVLVLTPPVAHAAVSRAAIAAGKHVYTEKPLATTRADAKAILATSSTSFWRSRPRPRLGRSSRSPPAAICRPARLIAMVYETHTAKRSAKASASREPPLIETSPPSMGAMIIGTDTMSPFRTIAIRSPI